jgi:hypothetical protein
VIGDPHLESFYHTRKSLKDHYIHNKTENPPTYVLPQTFLDLLDPEAAAAAAAAADHANTNTNPTPPTKRPISSHGLLDPDGQKETGLETQELDTYM